jgi:hypothetical protein
VKKLQDRMLDAPQEEHVFFYVFFNVYQTEHMPAQHIRGNATARPRPTSAARPGRD